MAYTLQHPEDVDAWRWRVGGTRTVVDGDMPARSEFLPASWLHHHHHHHHHHTSFLLPVPVLSLVLSLFCLFFSSSYFLRDVFTSSSLLFCSTASRSEFLLALLVLCSVDGPVFRSTNSRPYIHANKARTGHNPLALQERCVLIPISKTPPYLLVGVGLS